VPAAALPSPIVVRYQATPPSLPKHTRLRNAVVGALEAGELPVGSKVTGERELSEALGLSLGTTQKALGRLMDEGFLVRRQGHGTFVGGARQPIAGSWHFRFVAPEGGPQMPIFATVVERRLETGPGPWQDVLGPDPKGYVMLRRRVEVGGEFICGSRIYLPASRFSRLLRIAAKRLADTNLKTVLADDFAAPTLQSDGLSFVRAIPADDARLMNVQAGTVGMEIHIVGRSFGRAPITFQLMRVPPTRYALQLDFQPPGQA
jgi:GntR family transcriptional regulator